MLVKRSVFEAVGRFLGRIRPELSADLDFCLRVGALRKTGRFTNPTRNFIIMGTGRSFRRRPKERLEEFHQAIALFEERWSELIRTGDPFYNPNLTLEKEDFSLKRN